MTEDSVKAHDEIATPKAGLELVTSTTHETLIAPLDGTSRSVVYDRFEPTSSRWPYAGDEGITLLQTSNFQVIKTQENDAVTRIIMNCDVVSRNQGGLVSVVVKLYQRNNVFLYDVTLPSLPVMCRPNDHYKYASGTVALPANDYDLITSVAIQWGSFPVNYCG
jgi:hypothetical protein